MSDRFEGYLMQCWIFTALGHDEKDELMGKVADTLYKHFPRAKTDDDPLPYVVSLAKFGFDGDLDEFVLHLAEQAQAIMIPRAEEDQDDPALD